MKRLSRAEMRAQVLRDADIIDAQAVDNPFASSAWTLHFLDQVARDDWSFWCIGASDESQGLTLLYTEPERPQHALALTNYYASLYTPLLGASAGREMGELPRRLAAIRPTLATANLAPLDLAHADALEQSFRGSVWLTRRYHCFGNWHLPCERLTFDQYMAVRPSQLLNTWQRKSKRFRNASAGARLQLVTRPEDVAAGIRAYKTVYAQSWKIPEPYPDFVSGWAAICADRGWLRLGIAWVDDVPIAAQFWFTRNRRTYIYKLAYDESHGKLSAGTVLSAYLFQHSLDVDRVVEIDYLTGDDAYKRSWMSERRERVGLIACNPRHWQGLMRGGYEVAGAMRRRWWPAASEAASAGVPVETRDPA